MSTHAEKEDEEGLWEVSWHQAWSALSERSCSKETGEAGSLSTAVLHPESVSSMASLASLRPGTATTTLFLPALTGTGCGERHAHDLTASYCVFRGEDVSSFINDSDRMQRDRKGGKDGGDNDATEDRPLNLQ